MNDIKAVKAAVDEWNGGLDSGDLERMLATVDPEAVTCNENQPTAIGAQAVRDKYGPRMEVATFKSGWEYQHVSVHGDMAIVVGHFTAEITSKSTGEKSGGRGRLVIVYRRHPDGSWKMILDMDNND